MQIANFKTIFPKIMHTNSNLNFQKKRNNRNKYTISIRFKSTGRLKDTTYHNILTPNTYFIIAQTVVIYFISTPLTTHTQSHIHWIVKCQSPYIMSNRIFFLCS